MENAQPEPSMEEILASIRRIISEDEEGAAAEDTAAAPVAAPGATPAAVKPALVQKPATQEPTTTGRPAGEPDRADPHLETEDVEMIKQNVAEAIHTEAEDAMLDEGAASAASSAFANLSDSVRVSEGPGKTLEDIVTDMLKPMVKDWLDANLPAIVEEKVEEEVQRVARRRR